MAGRIRRAGRPWIRFPGSSPVQPHTLNETSRTSLSGIWQCVRNLLFSLMLAEQRS